MVAEAIKYSLPIAFTRDLLCIAIESSIGYWWNEKNGDASSERSLGWGSRDIQLWWYNKLSFDADLFKVGKREHYEVTPEKMIEKFEDWLGFLKQYCPWRHYKWTKAFTKDRILADCDLRDTDMFVQFCLFDDVIFGEDM